jgi:hypothetical protein
MSGQKFACSHHLLVPRIEAVDGGLDVGFRFLWIPLTAREQQILLLRWLSVGHGHLSTSVAVALAEPTVLGAMIAHACGIAVRDARQRWLSRTFPKKELVWKF